MATLGTKNVHSDVVSHEKEDEEDEVEKKPSKILPPPNEGVNDALKIARRGDY